MEKLSASDTRVVEISEVWLNWLEEVYPSLPKTATAISIGQVLLFILKEYEPPMEQFVPVLEQVLNTYMKTEMGYTGKYH